MKASKGPGARKGNLRPKQERRDDDIIHTNDSSIVSKRCVSKLYLSDEPDFYEPFAPTYVRRNPLVNRGYRMRIHAIEQVVHRFLSQDDGKSKVVVNLGCGYDPLPFQFWHRHASLSRNATFVDVDYPQLIERKRSRMLTNNLLRDALLRTKLRSSEQPVYLRSDQYMAIGCDLRNLGLLESILRAELNMPESAILFVAEVSVTYMPLADADLLIRWANTIANARFCVLEQYLPQGPGHPFALTMMGHFDKLQASINSVKQYQSLAQQSSRYLDAGWPSLEVARSLWDLWSDDGFTPPDLRKRLDAIEPFDEWEEFALYGGHYFLLVASNAETTETRTAKSTENLSEDCSAASVNSQPVSLQTWPQSTGTSWTPRRLTAAILLDRNTVAFVGGQGPQNRLPNMDVLSRDKQGLVMKQCSPLPSARVCHTTTSLGGGGGAILVGGRASPTQALADCWLIKDGEWSRINDLELARYRHCTVSVNVASQGSEAVGALVFGGKASDGTVLDDWLVWTANSGWRSIPVDGPRPPARFGAAMAAGGTAQDRGLLIGGIGAGGTVLEDAWEWSFSAAPEPRVSFQNLTNDAPCGVSSPTHARIGASLVPWGDSLLLVGGVSKKGIHSWAEDFVLLARNSTGISIEYLPVNMPSKRPLLVGMGVAAVSPDEILLAGGGAVCFAMGSFWNEEVLSITRTSTQETDPWRPVSIQTDGIAQSIPSDSQKKNRKPQQKKAGKFTSPRTKNIPRVQVHSKNEFSALCAAAKPAIIEGVGIGPCNGLWTADYLQAKLGHSRQVTVREYSSGHMSSKEGESQCVERSIASFIDSISSGSHAYLSADSLSQPNEPSRKLEDEFPEISADFQLPASFEEVNSTYHGSSLQISGPGSLPLHYDVLSNVICQVRGRKVLHVYPPSDVRYLSFPPGSSSSSIDVLTSRNPDLRVTHPHVAHLGPGDVLFIPPMWSHTATSEEGVNISVNVFWRSLTSGPVPNKDVYGKWDLKAYEDGRQDVEKIVRAFEGMPEDIKRFYLDRLAGEILEKEGKTGPGKKGIA